MKHTNRLTPIAIALAALGASSMAVADNNQGLGLYIDAKVNARADLALSTSQYSNETEVEIEKESDTKRKVDIDGDVTVAGRIPVNSSSASLVSQNQNNNHNKVLNTMTDNTADASDNALQGSSGNIGLNITAGDNNFQDNSAALSRVDAEFVFAGADTISNQNAEFNNTFNYGTRNRATLSGNTLRDATGNIGVNISAGDSNLQANSLAASVNTDGTMAEATVSSLQTGDHNFTNNLGQKEKVYDTVAVTMEGSVSGTLPDAEYVGTSDQYGDLYLDYWSGDTHPDGQQLGHIDVDNVVQAELPDGTVLDASDIDPNGDGGAFFFNEEGEILFSEAGEVTLGGSFTGEVVTTRWIVRPHQNNATLGGNALRNASGNIGVNVAAGTNNLQGNHLSIAAANGGSGTE